MHKLDAWVRRWALAFACVLAPLAFGIFANAYLAGWLNNGSELCAIARDLSFSLIGESKPLALTLSAEEQKNCNEAIAKRKLVVAAPPTPAPTPPSGVPAAAPSPSAAPAAAPAAASANAATAATKPAAGTASPHLQIVANHIAGRLNVAYAYAFLVLVSGVAFAFGSYVVVREWGLRSWLGTLVLFLSVTAAIAYTDVSGGGLRRFVADDILARADADALLQFLPATDNLRSLILFGLSTGYLAVGLILAALFVASIRWQEAAHLEGLKRRLFVIRAGLILGSAILIVVVLSSRAVFDWPLSLLVEADRKALAPAADALVRKWGAIGSISLIAAFLPAITAWYLDRASYRSTPQPPREPPERPPDEGELEIAPMSTVTSIVVVLGPIVASPIFDAFKSLLAAVQK